MGEKRRGRGSEARREGAERGRGSEARREEVGRGKGAKQGERV